MIATSLPTGATRPVPVPRTLGQLVDHLREVEASHADDAVVPMADLAMGDDGAIRVPGRGDHLLNDWSRPQLATTLGLRWDRWFAEASNVEVAEEVNRRLHRARGHVRVRTGLCPDGPVIRAVVSPTYEAVPDSSIATSLLRVLGDLRVTRSTITEMTTSWVVEVGETLKKGGVVGTLHGGLLVRNSDVGFASLAVVAHLVRLVCSNGMTAPVPDGEILRVRHRHLDLGRVEERLIEGAARLPASLRRAGEVVAASTERPVDGVEAEIRGVLREAHLLRRHERAVLSAYGREPHPTAFGVSQAMTLAAQEFSAEQRIELERVAGQYVARSTA